eukprot:GABV01000245.1.p1 GENE.GABV01000245.1~~GABV01000245.1.p1  ORF type:complete len:313 (-),score=112.66 GABV01000245.1:27-965(-)
MMTMKEKVKIFIGFIIISPHGLASTALTAAVSAVAGAEAAVLAVVPPVAPAVAAATALTMVTITAVPLLVVVVLLPIFQTFSTVPWPTCPHPHHPLTASCHPRPPPFSFGRPRADFICDVNLPDRTAVLPGQSLLKTWRMQNAGAAPWPENTRLVFIQGDRALVGSNETFEVPLAQPGEAVDVSVLIETPMVPGRYTASFRLRTPIGNNSNGKMFGQKIWVDLYVVEGEVEQAVAEGKAVEEQQQQQQQQQQAEGQQQQQQVQPQQPQPVDPTEVSLNVLEQMGFVDREKNLALLQAHHGDLQAVANALLRQ